MSEPLCLLTVHAHPDDEASKGAATCAHYAARGVRTVLVCCTGGEEGSILNPAMDNPEVLADLPGVRARELERSAEAIGFDEVVMLGYRDSGMPETPANANPDNFWNAPFEESLGRLVAIIRRTRPQVLIGYGEDHTNYPHPDHIRAGEITQAAFDAAGDPERFPEAGEPWTPSKLYYSAWSRERFQGTHEKMLELGMESPFDESWFKRREREDRITTRIDVTDSFHVRRQALLAHATQIDPTSAFWFALPDEVAVEVYPWDDFSLARSRVGDVAEGEIETDLFAGIEPTEPA